MLLPSVRRQSAVGFAPKTLWQVLILLASVFACSFGNISQANSQSSESDQLLAVLDDDFGEDSLANYTIHGDVAWAENALTISEGASIERTFEAWAHTRIDLGLGSCDLEKGKGDSELKVWMSFGKPRADICIRLNKEASPQQAGTTISLLQASISDASVKIKKVGSVPQDYENKDLRIEYRFGLVTIYLDDQEVLTSYVNYGSSKCVGVKFLSVSEGHRMNKISVNGDPKSSSVSESIKLNADQLPLLMKANSKRQESQLLRSQKKYILAAQLAKEVSEITLQAFGKQHKLYFEALARESAFWFRAGDVLKSRDCGVKAIALMKESDRNLSFQLATALNNTASTHLQLGDYKTAQAMIIEAKEIRAMKLGEEHPGFAGSVSNLGSYFSDTGNFPQAISCFTEALSIHEKVFGAENPEYLNELQNLSVVYRRMGKYKKAIECSEKVMRGLEKRNLQKDPQYARCLNGLGLSHKLMGDFDSAERFYTRALRIIEGLENDSSLKAMIFGNLGVLHKENGEFATAETYYKKTIEILGKLYTKNHPDYANSIRNLAVLYLADGRLGLAKKGIDQSLEITKELLGEMHPQYASMLTNLSGYYSRLDDSRAEETLLKSLNILKNTVGVEHPDYAANLSGVGVFHFVKGRYEVADRFFFDACRIVRNNLDRNSVVQSERQQRRNQYEKRALLDRLLSNVSNDPSAVLEEVWRWKGSVTARQSAYRQVSKNPQLAPLLEELKSISWQLSSTLTRAPISPGPSGTEAQLLAHETRRALWEQRFLDLSEKRETLEKEVAGQSSAFRAIKEDLTFAEVSNWLPRDTAYIEIIKYTHWIPAVDKGAKGKLKESYLAFVVRADETMPKLIRLGAAKQISEQINSFRKPFQTSQLTSDDIDSAIESGKKIRANFWLPVEEYLGGVKTVLISPDESFSKLPFEALPGPKKGTYLIEQYEFVSIPYAGLLRSILDGEATKLNEQSLLIVGDVNYDLILESTSEVDGKASGLPWMAEKPPIDANTKWKPLKGGKAETTGVSKKFKQTFGIEATGLRNSQATEANFAIEAQKCRTLHVVSHAFFAAPKFESLETTSIGEQEVGIVGEDSKHVSLVNRYMPGLLSGIVLAGANSYTDVGSNDDGILTATEIETLSMNGVDLVVLSACETGLGKTAGGEGVLGLQRAFQIAGVRSCIATLWKVDDNATHQFMERFYYFYWQKKQSKAQALRNAKLEMLKNPKLVSRSKIDKQDSPTTNGTRGDIGPGSKNGRHRTSPYFWAGFTLSGDWR